jgi:hypothetical protein
MPSMRKNFLSAETIHTLDITLIFFLKRIRWLAVKFFMTQFSKAFGEAEEKMFEG